MYLMRVDQDLAQGPDFRDQLIEIIQHITPPEGDDTMSVADYLEERGEQRDFERGRLAAKRESALRMLREGVEPAFVAKILDLRLEDIKALKRELNQDV